MMRRAAPILGWLLAAPLLAGVVFLFGDDELRRILLLRDYNTRVVVIGTTLLGGAAGIIGTFAYLRKRAMVGDALSHATLPGIAAAFLIVGDKQIGPMLLGATITGVLGVLAVIGLRNVPRIKEDAAIGIVLSVFFGIGLIFVKIAQSSPLGNQAGLDHFIYGTTAGMIRRDAILIGTTAIVVLMGVLLLFKEFRLVCFDQQFASVTGRSVIVIDLLMMAMIVLTTVVGLQAVGLILVVALLIIPAVSARFWTDHLGIMTILAGLFGCVSGYGGSAVSARFANLPTGAVIVLAAGTVFAISMMFAPHRGFAGAILRQRALRERIGRQNLLRALCEHEERQGEGARIDRLKLFGMRSWTMLRLNRLIAQAVSRDEAMIGPADEIGLTREGRIEALRILRNHRLWELYLIRHADVAPSHVDRDADLLEHVLPPDMVRELELALAESRQIPPSPHAEGAVP